jgi:hypothetical protein
MSPGQLGLEELAGCELVDLPAAALQEDVKLRVGHLRVPRFLLVEVKDRQRRGFRFGRGALMARAAMGLGVVSNSDAELAQLVGRERFLFQRFRLSAPGEQQQER